MQLQQKEFQQTIKEKEKKKRKAFYKNSLAKCNCSKYGLFPSTPGGILLFAEFSEHNLAQKEKKKCRCFHHFLSSASYEKSYKREKKNTVLLWKHTEACKADVLSTHKRDWLDSE